MASDRQSLNAGWILLVGVIGIIGAFLVYYLLLESTFGAFRIRQALPIGTSERAPRIALVRSEYSKTAYRITSGDPSGAWADGVMRSWRDFLLDPGRDLTFRELNDQDLERGNLDDYDVLVLPASSAMSDRQIEQLKVFMNRGGSVWATWTPGIYRPDGTWRGWNVLEDVFGVEFLDYIDREGGNYQAYTDTFPGYTPPGTYLPERLFVDSSGVAIDSVARRYDRSADPVRGRFVTEARQAGFSPLTGYRWIDTLSTRQPSSDFASADTVMASLRGLDGELRRQPAVAVTYYTWNGTSGGTNVSRVPFPYTGSGIRRLTLVAGTPLTAGVPGGYRVKTQVFNPAVRMRVRTDARQRTHAFGFWYDFAVEDGGLPEALETTTGAVYGTYGKGRFVYLGFHRSALFVDRRDAEDYEEIGKLFSNMLAYLRHRPLAWTHDWPAPYTSAAVFAGVGGQQPTGLAGAADALAAAGVPGAYFLRGDSPPDAALARRLAAQGDIGVYGDLQRTRDGTRLSQAERFRQWRRTLEAASGEIVRGYRPSHVGILSDSTLGALTAAGYTHFLPDSIGRSSVINVMGAPNSGLNRFNYTGRSDSLLFAQQGSLTAPPFLADLARTDYEGGLYRLVYSSDLLARPENVGVLRTVAQEARRRGMWTASATTISDWWSLRRRVATVVEQKGPNRLMLRLSNTDQQMAVSNVAVSLFLPSPTPLIEVRSELIQMRQGPPLKTTQSSDRQTVTLTVERLRPAESVVYLIDLKRADGSPLND